MSVTSSVSGGAGAEGVANDIIDLDRYMRAAVRPSVGRRGERLVVDAGRGAGSAAGSSSGSDAPLRPRTHKRYSHDSGVSDGSYVRRKQRLSRRPELRPRESSRLSSSSIREFKAVCERALREQQEQISRVAQLCERLAQPERLAQSERERSERTEQTERGRERPTERERAKRPVRSGRSRVRSESSEVSSTSQSSHDHRRKEKFSSDSCRTYKIIMTKLDELGRAFAARRQLSPANPLARRPPSSASVSVCDKFVATDPDARVARSLSPTIQTVYTSAVSERRRLQTARGAALDIAPHNRNNVVIHRVVKSDCTSVCSATDLNHCGFDLDDPVHLYAQAKRLNPLSGRVPFGRPSGPAPPAPRARSLCALCRGYWRALCQRLPAYISRDS
ncbi:uncharacterized protein LOC123703968 [Colias croceus]|uniref:uncharacterized protein LOC123703968 n=1 Tax=Colias crocea TaxID=72248 RepID=UPI001E2804CE|nr:uncharacterized protein LOC123703968 [Colias croceus]